MQRIKKQWWIQNYSEQFFDLIKEQKRDFTVNFTNTDVIFHWG